MIKRKGRDLSVSRSILTNVFHAHSSIWRRMQYISGISLATLLLSTNILVLKFDAFNTLTKTGVLIILLSSLVSTIYVMAMPILLKKKRRKVKSVMRPANFQSRNEYLNAVLKDAKNEEIGLQDIGVFAYDFYDRNVAKRSKITKTALKIYLLGIVLGIITILIGLYI